MKRILILLTIVFSLNNCAVFGYNRPSNTLAAPHFIIYYTPNQRHSAERTEEIAEKWYKILSSKLEISKAGRIPIYLYPDRQSFYSATGVKPNEAIVGLAHTRSLAIKIDASGAFADISRVIPHEIVHILIYKKLAGKTADLPLWMHEGIAKYLAEDWSPGDADLLGEIASSGRFIPFSKLTNVFPADDKKKAAAYVQSYSAVKYMTAAYSEASINDLLDEIADGNDFDTALRYSIGVDSTQFENDWRAYMVDKYRLGRWSNLLSALVSALMVVGILLAYKAYTLHRRKAIKRMEMEDELSHADDEEDDDDNDDNVFHDSNSE